MIRRIVSAFRVVMPPAWSVILFLFVFACAEGPVLYFEQRAGQPVVLSFRPGRWCLIAGAVLLAVRRVLAFHPFFESDYVRWLKSTPWTVDRPLPVGPVELVPQDALAIGGLMLLSRIQPQTDSIELLNVFLFAHSMPLIGTFWKTGVPGFGYVAALSLGFVPRHWENPWIALAILTGVYLVVHEGLWRSLARFPWATEGRPTRLAEAIRRAEEEFGPPCGWPYDRLFRDVKMATSIGRTDAVLISMLAGWWGFALEPWVPSSAHPPLALALIFQALLACRVSGYVVGYAPPISLAGRVATFRWIIPGYDRALLVLPLTILTPFIVMVVFGIIFKFDPHWWVPVIVATTTLVVLTTPPTLRNWRLTGSHRLVPAIPKGSQDFVQIG